MNDQLFSFSNNVSDRINHGESNYSVVIKAGNVCLGEICQKYNVLFHETIVLINTTQYYIFIFSLGIPNMKYGYLLKP